MSDEFAGSAEESPIINDAITADDAGFSSKVDKNFESEEESNEETVQAETAAELKEEIEEAIEDGATKEEVKQMIEEYELKVNGKTVKRTVDLNDKENIKRILQREMAGQQSMQEAAELKKLYANEIERLKNDPWAVLSELGLDPNEVAENRIRNQIEELKKSPEQLENERIRKELSEARKKLEETEQKAQQSQWEKMQSQAATELDSEITQALDAYTSLPRSPEIIQKIADHMLWAIENAESLGIDPNDIKVTDVLPSVENELKTQFNSMFDMLGEEAFEAYIGKRNVERMRKKRLNTVKTNNITNVKSVANNVVKESSEADRKKSRDYFKNLGKVK